MNVLADNPSIAFTIIIIITIVAIFIVIGSKYPSNHEQDGSPKNDTPDSIIEELQKILYAEKNKSLKLEKEISFLNVEISQLKYKFQDYKNSFSDECVRKQICRYFQFFQNSQNYREDKVKKNQLEYSEQHRKTLEKNIEVGTAFEKRVYDKLKELNHKNLLININYEGTQVDVISIRENGIYIFECKCWAGTVLGDKDWSKWIQIKDFDCYSDTTLENVTASLFANPIQQTKKQEYALRRLLRFYRMYNDVFFKRIIVFEDCVKLSESCNYGIGTSAISTHNTIDTYSKVIYFKQLEETLLQSLHWGNSNVYYNSKKIDAIHSAFADYEKGYGNEYKYTIRLF